MKPYDNVDEQAVQALLENLPMSNSTPEELREKLVEMAASPAPRHRQIRRPFIAFAMGGATVVAAIAIMTSLPATAKSWEGIKQAVQSVTRMEMLVQDLDENKENVRIGFSEGTILVQPDSGEIVFVSGNTVQVYDKSENVVREFPMPMGGTIPNIGKEVLSGMSMSKMLAQYEQEYGKENIKVGPVRNLSGRRVFDVAMRDPEDGGYANLVIDAATDLPISIEGFEYRSGEPIKVVQITARYNEAVDPNSLKPNFPEGAKFEKFDIQKIMDQSGGFRPPLGFGD